MLSQRLYLQRKEMRRAQPVTLTAEQQGQLERYANGRRVAVRLALRSRIILLAADGLENKQIAAQLSVSRQLVRTDSYTHSQL